MALFLNCDLWPVVRQHANGMASTVMKHRTNIFFHTFDTKLLQFTLPCSKIYPSGKSELARSIQKNLKNLDEAETPIPKHSMHVVDGGWLLHHIRWRKNSTYAQVLEQYSSILNIGTD